DEPSMSCYAYREDTTRLVDLFNRTVEPVVGRCYLATHLCFGTFKGRGGGVRAHVPAVPRPLRGRAAPRDGESRARGARPDRGDRRRREGRRRRHRGREELLPRDAGGRRGSGRGVPAATAP